jgi:hypothetical protein
MSSETIRHVVNDKQLASLGDAFVNFIYSLALTKINGRPQATKVSDRILSEAFRLAGLREYLGTRLSRKDLANAAESLLIEAYRKQLISIDESVFILTQNPDGLEAGLSNLLKLAADRIDEAS